MLGGEAAAGDAPNGVCKFAGCGDDQPDGGRGSSYDDGCVGGESPIRLMRFPGDPAMPAGPPLAQSFMLGDMLVANEVVDTASSRGDAPCRPFAEGYEGLISGLWRGGGEGLGEGPLGLSFGLSLSLLWSVRRACGTTLGDQWKHT